MTDQRIRGLLFEKIDDDLEKFIVRKFGSVNVQISKDKQDQLLIEFEDQVISDSLKNLYNVYPEFYAAHSRNQNTICKEFDHSFRYFFAYLNCVDHIFENARNFLMTNQLPSNYNLTLPHYGILVRLADQIGVLLMNGYPDGALRIWRSFYEFSMTTLLFLKAIDNDSIHKDFFDHFHRSKQKKAESHQKHHTALNFPSLDEELLNSIAKETRDLNTTHGTKFLDNDFGWCNRLLGSKKKVTLRDIEEYVGVNKFRPFYIWASGYTHPGFEAMTDFIEEDSQKIVLNKINRQTLNKTSFIDPMQLTVALFHEVNNVFIDIYSANSEKDINVRILKEVFVALLKSFDELPKE
ncbi:DUF5677 domain-containing protein [Flavihumibacter petaseus]|uniref:Uncharacterized protein n=1 Tax=Flavihumibacter petaseus NBRC 106054 TaxID=1220578 RepID=A0A0E9N3S2_9BACT|nr:DUF5677 domain-containing protein [Flavihumibacter petaseus]GAO44428.1 hypothetical protein FPE01S_03_04660 [Flavihumibacter petaseus NBRC 106054]